MFSLALLLVVVVVAVLFPFHWLEIRRFVKGGWVRSPYGRAVTPRVDGFPTTLHKPRLPLRCRKCGSLDIWRIQERTGIVAAVMKRQGRKLFKCMICARFCLLSLCSP